MMPESKLFQLLVMRFSGIFFARMTTFVLVYCILSFRKVYELCKRHMNENVGDESGTQNHSFLVVS